MKFIKSALGKTKTTESQSTFWKPKSKYGMFYWCLFACFVFDIGDLSAASFSAVCYITDLVIGTVVVKFVGSMAEALACVWRTYGTLDDWEHRGEGGRKGKHCCTKSDKVGTLMWQCHLFLMAIAMHGSMSLFSSLNSLKSHITEDNTIFHVHFSTGLKYMDSPKLITSFMATPKCC